MYYGIFETFETEPASELASSASFAGIPLPLTRQTMHGCNVPPLPHLTILLHFTKFMFGPPFNFLTVASVVHFDFNPIQHWRRHMNTEVSSNQTAVLPQGVSVANPWVRLGSYFLEAILMMVTLGIGWLIWACMTASSGQTPAKKMLKLRVIDANTLKPSGFGKMFWVRGILAGMVAQLAILCTLGILLFMPFWDKRNQNIWDKVSGTYVVNDPTDAWQTKPNLVSN